jgi:hypothetical protein
VAHELLLISQGDPQIARSIFDAFAERTGLLTEPVAGGVRYTLDGADHRVKVIETLRDIDASWAQHIALGSRRVAVTAQSAASNTTGGPVRLRRRRPDCS